MKNKLKVNPFSISISVVIIGIVFYFVSIPFLDLMELKTIDLRFLSRGRKQTTGKIVIAALDEKSLAVEGKWRWPRWKIADLITKLSNHGARVIALDIGFFEPDECDSRMINVIDNLRNQSLRLGFENSEYQTILRQIETRERSDDVLAQSISDSDAVVVLGYFFVMEQEKIAHITPEAIYQFKQLIAPSQYSLIKYNSPQAKKTLLPTAAAPTPNIKPISDAARACGFFNMLPDTDGVVRRMPGLYECGDTLYAPLSLKAASEYLNGPLSIEIAEYGVSSISVGKNPLPVDEYGQIMVNYRGDEKTFDHISITDIIRDKADPALFKDKLVFVGATAIGVYDMRITPFGKVFPGVEIHANIADNVLARDFMSQPNWLKIVDMLVIAVIGIFLGFALPRTGVGLGALAVALVFGGYIVISEYMFVTHGLILNLVYPLSVALLIYIALTTYKYFTESRQKRFIKDAFSTYLAPSVVKQLIDSPDRLVLGGEERTITAFFSDIQGFTTISEKMPPRELVPFLNHFLTEMTDIILDHLGLVDKFEGDAIISMFGAPTDIEDQGDKACSACIAMQEKMGELRTIWKEQGKPELKMRIGMNTGTAIVGNMGTQKHMDYTMMGDTVNIAARLEGVNKVYGTYTMISESTLNATSGGFVVRELDSVLVVGKLEPIIIFELIGKKGEIGETKLHLIENYENGLHAYRAREFEKAGSLFKKGLEIEPDDGPCREMLKRCEDFILHPPPEGWNGAYSMKSK